MIDNFFIVYSIIGYITYLVCLYYIENLDRKSGGVVMIAFFWPVVILYILCSIVGESMRKMYNKIAIMGSDRRNRNGN